MSSTITTSSLLPAISDINWERFRLAPSDDKSMPNATLVVDHFGGNVVVGSFDSKYGAVVAHLHAKHAVEGLNQQYWLDEGITMVTAMQHDASLRPANAFGASFDWFSDGGDIYDWHGLRVTNLVSELAAEYYLDAVSVYYRSNMAMLCGHAVTAIE